MLFRSLRDDNHRKEQPDHAKNLPIINEVPFLGNDSLPYSPPVYPTPNVSGLGYWDDAVGKARSDVEKLNLTDLVDLVTGSGWGNGPCVGNIKALSKINFKGLCLQDSPDGLRGVDRVTVFPDGITTGATFSKDLMYARGKAMGEEFRRKGAHVQLGPMVNVARAPSAGRNFEGFGADPYVNGEGAYYTTLGVQDQGVQATLKHYIANEQEHFRNSGSSNVDGRTERELYLHPFMRGIQAGAVSVMCAYNLVNNSWACQNSELLNGRLKTELNFQGYVMSDWGAQHSGVASALAGLDMTMPGQTECCEKNVTSYFWGVNLTEAVNNGTVPKSRLDDMATRVLAGYYFLHQDKDYPKTNFDFFDILDPAKNDAVDATEDHDEISRHIAAAGTVLLKNENDTLPLRKPKKLAMVGSGAAPLYEGPNRWADRVGWPYGTLGQGWGSGSVDYSYFISPYEAIQRRARKDHTAVNWCFDDYDLKTAQSVANYSDAALVFVSSLSGEGFGSVPASDGLNGNMGDRNNITLWNGGEQLIKAVTEVNNNTIVVVHSVGAVLMEDWIENPNVTAVLMAHLPGAESGNALVDVLWGEYNPSGRLPYTIAKNREDYPADVLYNSESAQPQINYTEGLLMDYRAFDKHNIEPRFAFGHGLSYTSFNYSDLSVEFVGDEVRKDDCRWNYRWGKDRAPSGLPSWIFEPMYNISFTVQNTGNRDGHEVVQVYLAFPEESGEPPLVLREFDRIWLSKGHDQRLTFSLSHYDVSTWDIAQQQWLQPNGTIYVRAGGSSRALPLKKKLT
ncbi:beta-glucosidase [Malassezia vespertilionis]|uniref:beta-glucosidase n=1 Tax=Malassezia vespertilionis TaxID=2020962 RepID=UPI0024B0EBB8|nr:beta-glucosidase [Malassezia vespertilionis]WFD04695.1 beta-glucosidase [Malassezia vespertilionis]